MPHKSPVARKEAVVITIIPDLPPHTPLYPITPPPRTCGQGVHVNGFVRKAEGLQLWVGRRAKDKATAPGKLDHIVAGGQPFGLSVFDNLLKELAADPLAEASRATNV